MKKLSLALLIALACPAVHGACRPRDPNESKTFRDYLYVAGRMSVECDPFSEFPGPSFDKIEKDRAQFKDYDGFLVYLKREYPSFFKTPVILHKSASLQFASFEYPRILLYEGRSVFAFSEHPDQVGRRVEIIEYDPQTRQPSFKEIVFRDGEMNFERSPTSCTTCHGSPSKAIWNPYSFWPNALASGEKYQISEKEVTAFNEIVEKLKSKEGVYKHITHWQGYQYSFSGTEAFTQHIFTLEIYRWVATNWAKLQKLGRSKFVMLADIMGPEGFNSCMTDPVRDTTPVPFKTYRYDTIGGHEFFLKLLTKEYVNKWGEEGYRNVHERFRPLYGSFRWILENHGIKFQDLLTSFPYHTDVQLMPAFFYQTLLQAIFSRDPDFFEDISFLQNDRHYSLNGGCGPISKKIAEMPAPEYQPLPFVAYNEMYKSAAPIAQCIQCHNGLRTDLRTGPLIPFDDSVALARRLKTEPGLRQKISARLSATDSTQMPPDQPLSEKDRKQLESYFDFLMEISR